jgi:hypothetical protein
MDGPDFGAWYHPEFLRGKPSALAAVKRTAVKKDTSQAYSTSLVKVQMKITPNFRGMPPIEMDTPEETKKALGENYLPASNGRRDSPSDEDGMLHQFANAQTSKNMDVMAGQAIIHNPHYSSCWQNPALAMQSTWTGTSLVPVFMYHYLNQFGCAGYHSLPYGCEDQSVPALKSEEIRPDGVANRDQELKQPLAVSQLSTTMPDSNGNVDGLNASVSVLGTDDLVTKAFQYAFKDVPPRHMETQDNDMASVQHSFCQHSTVQGDCSTFDSIRYQQDRGISLPATERLSLRSNSVDRGFSTGVGFSTLSQGQWEYLEEDDELVRFINDF